MKNKIKGRNSGIFLSYVYLIISTITGLFMSSFLLRLLGDIEYGIYQTIGAFANYLVLFELGTGTIMTRNISLCKAEQDANESLEKNVSTISIISIILTLVIVAVSVLFYLSLGYIYRGSMSVVQIQYAKKIFIFLVGYLVFSFLTQTLNGFLLGNEEYTFANKLSIFRIVFRTVILVVVILFSQHSIWIAVVDAIVCGIVLIWTWAYCKKKFSFSVNVKKFDKKIFAEMLPLCLAIFIQAIVNQANSNVDKFVIGIKLNPQSVTLYSIALFIYSMFSSMTTIPISMYMPQVAAMISKKCSKDELTESLVAPCRMIVLIGGTILFGFVAVGQQFIALLYGADKLLAYEIALIIMIPMFINMSNGILVNVLDVYNKRLVRSYALIGTTALNVVLTVWWIDKYGMVGAAAATAICTFLGQVAFMNFYYYKYLEIDIFKLFKKAYYGILIFQLLGAVFAYVIGRTFNNLFVSFVVGGIAFLAIEGLGILFVAIKQKEKNPWNIIKNN